MDHETGGSDSDQIVKKSVTLIGKVLIIFFWVIVIYIESVELKMYEKSLAVLCISLTARRVFKLRFS